VKNWKILSGRYRGLLDKFFGVVPSIVALISSSSSTAEPYEKDLTFI
jgi:hypothetical protein